MATPPQRKHCKTCKILIPVAEWPDHKQMHEDQLELFENDK